MLEASAELVEVGAAGEPPLLPELVLSKVEIVAEAGYIRIMTIDQELLDSLTVQAEARRSLSVREA